MNRPDPVANPVVPLADSADLTGRVAESHDWDNAAAKGTSGQELGPMEE